MKRRAAGLTLIELMVALAIFAVLGVLTYRGTSHLLAGREAIGTELARWRDLGRAMQRVENDILQLAAPAVPNGSQATPPLELVSRAHGDELRLLVVTTNGLGARRTAFAQVDDRLEWRRWDGRDTAAAPERDTLLEGVRAVRWHFLADGRRLEQWPPAASQTTTLPDAVEIELDLAGVGVVTRLHALR